MEWIIIERHMNFFLISITLLIQQLKYFQIISIFIYITPSVFYYLTFYIYAHILGKYLILYFLKQKPHYLST